MIFQCIFVLLHQTPDTYWGESEQAPHKRFSTATVFITPVSAHVAHTIVGVG